MKISLIHPSRGRANKSFTNHAEWISKAGCEVETVVCVDTSDSQMQQYIDLYGSMCYASNNSSVVEATNYAASKSTGDILIYFCDDFRCPDNWGQLVLKEFEGIDKPTIIKIDDKLQEFHIPVFTMPIMNRLMYQRLGYFFHPSYLSMWVDCDLYEVAKRLNAIKLCKHLVFPHEHVSIGKAEDDDTYRRSAANWEQGKSVFAKRKSMMFPV